MDTPSPKQYLNTREAAEALGVSEATVRRWVNAKPPKLRADVTVTNQFRFRPEYIEEARPRPIRED